MCPPDPKSPADGEVGVIAPDLSPKAARLV